MSYKCDLWDKYPTLEEKHIRLAKVAWDVYAKTERQTIWGRRRLKYMKDYAMFFKKYPHKHTQYSFAIHVLSLISFYFLTYTRGSTETVVGRG